MTHQQLLNKISYERSSDYFYFLDSFEKWYPIIYFSIEEEPTPEQVEDYFEWLCEIYQIKRDEKLNIDLTLINLWSNDIDKKWKEIK